MLRTDSGLVDWEPTGEGMLRYLRLHSAALKLASRALFLRCSVSISSCSSAFEREPLSNVPPTEPLLLCSIFTQSVKKRKLTEHEILPLFGLSNRVQFNVTSSATRHAITLVLSEGGNQ